jgi:hypothetical protein
MASDGSPVHQLPTNCVPALTPTAVWDTRLVCRHPNVTNRKEVLECSGHRLSQPPAQQSVTGVAAYHHRVGPFVLARTTQVERFAAKRGPVIQC